ncbi:MAG: ATP-binding protein [Planctomycetota bacterium]
MLALTQSGAPRDRATINFEWLIMLRWAAVLGQLVTVLVVHYALAVVLPMPAIFAVLATEVATNAFLIARQRRYQRSLATSDEVDRNASRNELELLQTISMVFDTVLVFALLALTGGASNPFSAFLLVHVVLAGALLRPRYSLIGAGFVAVAVVMLPFVSRELPVLHERPKLAAWGTVVAIALTSLLVAFFTSRVRAALDRRSYQLQLQRERQQRARHLESLGTLAAGAAHELGTPLSTIAVVAKELERALEKLDAPVDVLGDARLVREEVARCRRILDRMNVDAGEQAGEPLVHAEVGALVSHVVAELQEPERVDVRVEPNASVLSVRVPREGLTTALRALVQNALDASQPEQSVALRASVSAGDLELFVVDQGHGMEPEHVARAGEPFFTTKEPGRGMGLGVYLARSVVERLGGALEYTSRVGAGTTVKVTLPLSGLARPARGAG